MRTRRERANNLRANSACICSSQKKCACTNRRPTTQGPRVYYKACENAPRYDQSSRLGSCVRYDRCQHRLLYVDQSSTFIILYYSVPVLFAHSVQGCLLAVIACSSNSSWLCSSATGLLNGSNGGSFVHWLKETPTPDFSKQERQSGCGSR